MRISNVQSFALNNFKYKNNPINFGARYNPNTQEGDIVEIHRKLGLDSDKTVAYRKYFTNGKEIFPNLQARGKGRLFIDNRILGYTPYHGRVNEYSAENKLIRSVLYNNGYKFLEETYDKNGHVAQEDMYEDTTKGCYYPYKRTQVRKLEWVGGDSDIEYNTTFDLSRNYGKDWQLHPEIEMEKTKGDKTLRVIFHVPSQEDDSGMIEVEREDSEDRTRNTIYIHRNTTSQAPVTDYEDILKGLIELKRTIFSNEYRDDFGFSYKFNSALDKYIKIITSRINAG